MLVLALLACAPDVAQIATLRMTLTNVSAPGDLQPSSGPAQDHAFAPGIVIVHDETFALFVPGEPIAYAEVEAMAEDGNPDPLKTLLATDPAVTSMQYISRQVSDTDYANAPMHPGESASTSVTVIEGQYVTVAFMVGQSNDAIIATGTPVAGFVDGEPASGDWTGELGLWDVGTEVNEELGLGANQAPRQAAAGDGDAENQPVTAIDGTDGSGFGFPEVGDIAELTAEGTILEPVEE